MKQRPQIESRVNLVAKLLSEGKDRKDFIPKLAKKWKLSKTSIDRYIRRAKNKAKKLTERKEKVTTEAIISETKKAIENGLRSKIERILNLQKQIYDSQVELDIGIKVDYVIISGQLQKVNKVMTPLDKAYVRKVIKDLEAEISKMEGDYAPAKIAQTDSKGNDITQKTNEELIDRLKYLKKIKKMNDDSRRNSSE